MTDSLLPKAQDLQLVQMLHTANVCWLKKNHLPAFHLVAQTNLGTGDIDLHFGIPNASPDTHSSLLQSWMVVVRAVERLYTLKMLLSETQHVVLPVSVMNDWKAEGEALHHALFDEDTPGVVQSFDAALQKVQEGQPQTVVHTTPL
jgi:hypothetical protein